MDALYETTLSGPPHTTFLSGVNNEVPGCRGAVRSPLIHSLYRKSVSFPHPSLRARACLGGTTSRSRRALSAILPGSHRFSWDRLRSDSRCRQRKLAARQQSRSIRCTNESSPSVDCWQPEGGFDQGRWARFAVPLGRKHESKQLLWPAIARAAGKALLIFLAAAAIWSVRGVPPAHAMDLVGVKDVAASRFRDILRKSWPMIVKCTAELKEHGVMLASLLAASAFFSLAETSITTLWPWKVRELAEKEKEEGLGDTFRLLQKDVTRFLTTILIGSTIANIAATALVTESVTSLFGEAGIGAATVVMTVVVLLLTEIAPKSIAVHNAAAVANFVVRPVHWLSTILYPVGRVCTWLSVGLLKLLGLKSSGETLVSEEEMKLMLSGAMMSGTIEPGEQDMIEAVLEMDDTTVKEVMTALVDVEAIESKATLMELRDLWIQHQYSRIPVYEKRVDKIVGIAYAMDMLDYVDEPDLLHQLTVERIVHKNPYFVPDVMSVWNLLREFRIRKVHMAIVVNEYGGTTGIVTLEDVVEEIVGEIYDENDSKEEIRKRAGYIIKRDNDTYDIDANTSIDHLEEELHLEIPEGQFETVSGWVCGAFGYIPRSGESVTVTLKKTRRESRESREDEQQKKEQEQDHHHRGEEKDAEKDDADRAKYILRVTMANARKVQTVRLEKASEDQPLTGPPDEKLALMTKRLRGWKEDYEPPKGHKRAEYGGKDGEEREQEGKLYSSDEEGREQEGDPYSSDEEGPAESGELGYDQGFRSDDEEAGSSDQQYSDVEEQYSEAEDGFLDGPLSSHEVAQHESITSKQPVEGENGGASIGVDEITLKPAELKSLQAMWEAKAKVVERRRARRRQEAALAAAELARIERFKGEGLTISAGRSKNNKRSKRRAVEPDSE